MDKMELKEIKKGEYGKGLLIENDGYISMKETSRNKRITEDYLSGQEHGEWHVPNPFIVDAVFQKYGIQNANGRIYPESVLKRQVAEYQKKVAEHYAYGECYRPEAMILTEKGWKQLKDVKKGEKILTLDYATGEIVIQPITRKIELSFAAELVHIKGKSIDDYVTPNHKFPIYDESNKYMDNFTAEDIVYDRIPNIKHTYIPKLGVWMGEGNRLFSLKNNNGKGSRRISMSSFCKLLGYYLTNGTADDKTIILTPTSKATVEDLDAMLSDLEFFHMIENGKVKVIDAKLVEFLKETGEGAERIIPLKFKQQSVECLSNIFEWAWKGNEIDFDAEEIPTGACSIYTPSKQLALDFNEIIFKMGYTSIYEECDNKGEVKLFQAAKSLVKCMYLDKRYMEIEYVEHRDKVMCVEVKNHNFYVMDNGFCHWTCNCNHPAESTIDLGRVSHNITELHWEGSTLVGQMELNISEGFRKFGICSSLGDTIALLLLNGYKIGVSSRGVGSVESRLGQTIVGDDFELICWDIVSNPSTPGAFIGNPESLQQYIESKKPINSKLIEKIDKIDEILKG